MKLKNIVCASLATLSMASCTAESDAIVNEVEASVSFKKNFNARSIDYPKESKNGLNLNDLVPVTADKATAATACTSLNTTVTFT